MDDLRAHIEELSLQGLNCSQIMLTLSHEIRDVEYPELIRALAGLGGGMYSRKACGTLTGACCLLATYATSDSDDEPKFNHKEVVPQFVSWFEEKFGSTECKDLVADDKESRFEFCPMLMEESFKKCMEMLSDLEVDIYE